MYAKQKLEEARYFLNQMWLTYTHRKFLIFNMNAFLNAARNVTFTLASEFKHNQKFNAWYERKQKEMKKDNLMNFFNKLRIVSVHKKGTPKHSLSLKAAYILPKDKRHFKFPTFGYSEKKYSSEDKIEVERDLGLVFPSMDKSKFKIVKPVYTLVTFWEFDKGPKGYQGSDIFGLCLTYYHKLKELVNEAEAVLSKKE